MSANQPPKGKPVSHANLQPVLLAVGIMAALAGAVGVLIMQAPEARVHQGVAATSREPAGARIPGNSRAALVRGAGNTDRLNPRQEYAAWLHRRLRLKGRTCRIQATGDMGQDLTISWTPQDFEKEGKGHFEQLKGAQGFFAGLKVRRFSRLIMKVGDKLLFTKAL